MIHVEALHCIVICNIYSTFIYEILHVFDCFNHFFNIFFIFFMVFYPKYILNSKKCLIMLHILANSLLFFTELLINLAKMIVLIKSIISSPSKKSYALFQDIAFYTHIILFQNQVIFEYWKCPFF